MLLIRKRLTHSTHELLLNLRTLTTRIGVIGLGQMGSKMTSKFLDRSQVMDLLSSTIFNCVIYKGYGQRVANRDHRPGGFSLELGLKDVTLVSDAARQAQVPMPFLSVLVDRYTSARAKGRAALDWSAIGLNAAEDAGIDVSADISRNARDVAEGRTY